jgi:N-acyl-D-amino-acid deacylase
MKLQTSNSKSLRDKILLATFALASFVAIYLARNISAVARDASSQSSAQFERRPVEFLLTGGEVIDGTGSPSRRADIGISSDRIVFIGNAQQAHLRGMQTINCAGLIVAPGFIDPHTHADSYLNKPDRKNNLNYIMQGVTTVVVGNDGDGPVHVAAALEKYEQQGIGTNVAMLTGFGTARRQVLGNADVAPTPEQLEQMRSLIRGAMQEGAFGISTGLFYVPQSFAKTEEVIELAKIAAQFGGFYDTHMRDEDSYSIGLLGAVDETLRIGREAKIPVHISHIKALGPAVWGKSADVVARIDAARAAGQNVSASQYPYLGSGSSLPASLLSPWAQEGNREQISARLSDPAQRDRLLADIKTNLERRGGAAAILFPSQRLAELAGKTLADVAASRKMPPVETALAILQEAARNNTWDALGIISFSMNEADVDRFMQQPWVMTGSDGSPGHPRLFGTFPRKIHDYVIEKKLITMPFAIRSSSALAAELLGLTDRGQLKQGYFADVIAFDPATVADTATYTHPENLAIGMRCIFINGALTVRDGTYTGALAGKVLRHAPKQ